MNDSVKYLFPFYKEYHRLNYTRQGISYWDLFRRKIFGGKTYWNIHHPCTVQMPQRLFIGKCSNVMRDYNFFQCSGGIFIGNYVEFATRVSLLSSNHDLYDQRISHPKPIKIGDYSWLGMHSTLLAGVEIGPRTIVANGAVVTKSFPDGMCVLAGVPAKVVKKLDLDKFKPWEYKFEYYGFIPANEFESNPQLYLDKFLDKDYFSIIDGKIRLVTKHMNEE